MTSIDLEVLWEKFGRYQLMALSLAMAQINWIFNILVMNFLSREYSDSYNCTLIYPLAFNKVQPEKTALMIQMMNVVAELTTFLLKDLFPVLYLLHMARDNYGKANRGSDASLKRQL